MWRFCGKKRLITPEGSPEKTRQDSFSTSTGKNLGRPDHPTSAPVLRETREGALGWDPGRSRTEQDPRQAGGLEWSETGVRRWSWEESEVSSDPASLLHWRELHVPEDHACRLPSLLKELKDSVGGCKSLSHEALTSWLYACHWWMWEVTFVHTLRFCLAQCQLLLSHDVTLFFSGPRHRDGPL